MASVRLAMLVFAHAPTCTMIRNDPEVCREPKTEIWLPFFFFFFFFFNYSLSFSFSFSFFLFFSFFFLFFSFFLSFFWYYYSCFLFLFFFFLAGLYLMFRPQYDLVDVLLGRSFLEPTGAACWWSFSLGRRVGGRCSCRAITIDKYDQTCC